MKITVKRVPRPPTYVSFAELDVGSTFVPQWSIENYRIKVSGTYFYDFVAKKALVCDEPDVAQYQRIDSELIFYVKGV